MEEFQSNPNALISLLEKCIQFVSPKTFWALKKIRDDHQVQYKPFMLCYPQKGYFWRFDGFQAGRFFGSFHKTGRLDCYEMFSAIILLAIDDSFLFHQQVMDEIKRSVKIAFKYADELALCSLIKIGMISSDTPWIQKASVKRDFIKSVEDTF